MVYINSESVQMTVLKSKNAQITELKLINQTDNSELSFDLGKEDVEYNKNTLIINLDNILPELKVSGQYDYYLYENNEIVESGILQFNDFTSEINSYNINKKIIQYEG